MIKIYGTFISIFASLWVLLFMLALLNKQFDFVGLVDGIDKLPLLLEIQDFKKMLQDLNWDFNINWSWNIFTTTIEIVNEIGKYISNVFNSLYGLLKLIILSPIESIVYLFSILFN